MFDITKEDLKDLLRDIHAGKIQLPEFHAVTSGTTTTSKSLIASVAKGYPVRFAAHSRDRRSYQI